MTGATEPTPFMGRRGELILDFRGITKIFRKCGRESVKGQSPVSSHLLTFFPTFPHCNTTRRKNGHSVIHLSVKYAYDKKVRILVLKTVLF